LSIQPFFSEQPEGKYNNYFSPLQQEMKCHVVLFYIYSSSHHHLPHQFMLSSPHLGKKVFGRDSLLIFGEIEEDKEKEEQEQQKQEEQE
jgi:hypothetical protein